MGMVGGGLAEWIPYVYVVRRRAIDSARSCRLQPVYTWLRVAHIVSCWTLGARNLPCHSLQGHPVLRDMEKLQRADGNGSRWGEKKTWWEKRMYVDSKDTDHREPPLEFLQASTAELLRERSKALYDIILLLSIKCRWVEGQAFSSFAQ